MKRTSLFSRIIPLFLFIFISPCGASDEPAPPRRTTDGVRALVESVQSPAALVRAALEQAAVGDTSQWNHYLMKAIEADPEYAPARWRIGFVRDGDQWLTIDQANERSRENDVLTSYQKLREESADTAAGQLTLARWCLNNGLKDSGRAHLTQVLLKDPNNAAAQTQLGDRLIRGNWISAETLEQQRRRQLFVADWRR